MTTDPYAGARQVDSRCILDLVASGNARSRSQLASKLGVAASTVGLRVQALIESGLLQEAGDGTSRGGRRPRLLKLAEDGGTVLTADLGGNHARIGRHGPSGAIQQVKVIQIDVVRGPEKTLNLVAAEMKKLVADSSVRSIGVGLPGPVHIESGSVDQPSRMPGWSGFPVAEYLEQIFTVPVAVDNDANLAALAEHRAQFGRTHHSITVKAGTAIGSGIVVDGRVHRGASGAAGDITHARVDPGRAGIPCSCGNTGCLETVASGASLVQQLQGRGFDHINSTEQVLELARDANPVATTHLRTAGTYLGQALSGIVNFYNPHAVFLTGSMSTSEPFLAAVRSRIYEACHPLITRSLRIEAASTGPDAIILGAANLALDMRAAA